MCPLNCGYQLIGNEMSQGTSFWYSHKNLGKHIWNQRFPPPWHIYSGNFIFSLVLYKVPTQVGPTFILTIVIQILSREGDWERLGRSWKPGVWLALFLHNLNNTAAFFGMTSRGQGILSPTEKSSRKARVTRELSWLILLPLLFICLHQARYHWEPGSQD